MKIKLSKQEWLRVGQTAGWSPKNPNDFSDKDLGSIYTANEEENELLGKSDPIEKVKEDVYQEGYKIGKSKDMDSSSCPYREGTDLWTKWWEGFDKGKSEKSNLNTTIAKSIKIIKVAELSENIVPIEQIIGTSPQGSESQIDKDMHSKGYFLFREHYKWGKNLSYQNKNGDKVFLSRDDQGNMVWMTFEQLKEQVKKTWRPSSREDQDWFVANLGA